MMEILNIFPLVFICNIIQHTFVLLLEPAVLSKYSQQPRIWTSRARDLVRIVEQPELLIRSQNLPPKQRLSAVLKSILRKLSILSVWQPSTTVCLCQCCAAETHTSKCIDGPANSSSRCTTSNIGDVTIVWFLR